MNRSTVYLNFHIEDKPVLTSNTNLSPVFYNNKLSLSLIVIFFLIFFLTITT